LGLLVEVGRVVFVALDHEPRAASETGAEREIVWRAADQPAGIAPAALEHERQHRCRRRLAVRPRDHQWPPPAKEQLLERLGERHGAQAALACGPRLGVVARDRVAADHEIDAVEAAGLPAPRDRDAEVTQDATGGRVRLLVRTGDRVPRFAQQRGECTHADATGGDQMHLHASRTFQTASCTRGRTSRMRSFWRSGCTRLVRRTTWASRSRSIQSDVPVKPRWPTAHRLTPGPALDATPDGV